MACLVPSLSRKAGGLHDSVRRLNQHLQVVPETEIYILGMRDEYTDQDIQNWSPLPTQAFNVYGPDQFGYAPDLRQVLVQSDFDILQTNGIWMYTSVAASEWHKRTRKPVIVTPHGMLDPWAVRNSYWKKRVAGALYENRFLQNAACVRALCQSEAAGIRSYGLKNPICIIPNGIDIPEKSVTAPPPWEGRVEKGHKVLLYLGRIHPKKGLPNLLKAWKSLQNLSATNEWALAIAGWDQNGHEGELKQFISSNNLENSVYFLGPQFGEAKASAYQNADAFILPSFSEGLPMVVLEAWAYNLPVLMTPECNLPETFGCGAAIRIETKPEVIASGLKELFSMTEERRKAMGSAGYRLVQERYTWEKVSADLHRVVQWLLGGGVAPDCINYA